MGPGPWGPRKTLKHTNLQKKLQNIETHYFTLKRQPGHIPTLKKASRIEYRKIMILGWKLIKTHDLHAGGVKTAISQSVLGPMGPLCPWAQCAQ